MFVFRISKKDKVIHLHGSYTNGNDDLVVTTRDYIEHYRKDKAEEISDILFDNRIVFVTEHLESKNNHVQNKQRIKHR